MHWTMLSECVCVTVCGGVYVQLLLIFFYIHYLFYMFVEREFGGIDWTVLTFEGVFEIFLEPGEFFCGWNLIKSSIFEFILLNFKNSKFKLEFSNLFYKLLKFKFRKFEIQIQSFEISKCKFEILKIWNSNSKFQI